ncbi:MAG: hypothetical protein DCC43_05805 [Candidatus Brocadia sp.]|jgi:Nucleotidyltransferase domain.|uniref:Nucleotidyltransferase domain protein n=1 Tax=Candidatus Brocadia fulgida TaxID=380242 RepID=A0A0M2UZ54_9BACT|nr:MAG: Nucleotidyltransferase domain protein [Candidatus Brocadia fulgida]MCC6324691.1 nucleotidyltransferase domain-containing protein [Candidatus Brocadia sp.]MCE7910598.1 nucleotidyltransferase domain-containing protein [Candidatus Brocadia sp. AMX3]OQY99369.1 MAG: hypothetical protein B6D35_09320 [Candidatus Brocadia sp. UTAMX2]MBV6518146.1 hypothetical protein [Candidatus Brocadia fulgida]
MKKSKTDKESLVVLKETVVTLLKNEKVKIILFGSRARGDNYISSDVDIGIIPVGQFNEKPITLLREKIDNLNIPYKVEIVNLSEVSEEFRKEIMKDFIVWKD